MRALVGMVWLGAAALGCTPSKPASEAPAVQPGQSKQSASATTSAAPAEREPIEPPPPSLELEVLQERLALGLSVQNRSDSPQRLSSTLRLRGERRTLELSLSSSRDCLVLRPGGEWLWPQDWGLTLAPDQQALEGLEGRFHFEVTGCEGGAALRSRALSLPLRYR